MNTFNHMLIDYSIINNPNRILLEFNLDDDYEANQLETEFSQPLKERFKNEPEVEEKLGTSHWYKKLCKFGKIFLGGVLQIRVALRAISDPTKLNYEDALSCLIELFLLAEYALNAIENNTIKEKLDIITAYYEEIYDMLHQFDK